MKIKRKEIIGLILLLVALLCTISIIGYDVTEQPGGLPKNKIINSPLGYLGYMFLTINI